MGNHYSDRDENSSLFWRLASETLVQNLQSNLQTGLTTAQAQNRLVQV
ncbi:cation-transporting P-type ATPase, partial [Klebsiella variicola]